MSMRKQDLCLISALAAAISAGSTAAKASTVVVSPGNMNGWAFVSTDEIGDTPGYTGTIGQMVDGPATPPLGTGSAQLATASTHGDASSQLNLAAFDGTRVDALTSLGYSTYDTTNNGQQFPYLKLAIATTGSGPADDALFFEPPYQTPASGNASLPDQGDTAMNQWQTWNALTGGWWDNNGLLNPGTDVGSLSTYLATYPDATIVGTGASLRVGFASPDDNFNGYVDNFTIGTSDSAKTFNFEASVPEPGSLSLLAVGAAGLVARRRRRLA